MLDAESVPMLISMLSSQPAAADLLCIMATRNMCKEAFLDPAILSSLIACLHASASSGQSPCSNCGTLTDSAQCIAAQT